MTPAGPQWSGLTDTYVRVHALHASDQHNRIQQVRCTSADAEGLHGRLVFADDADRVHWSLLA
jgi:hypothetical protein